MLTYGFYNSQYGDRQYSADDFSGFLDGIVYDGVYNAIGNCFHVETTNNPNELKVGPGRAWFNRTWTFNDSNYILSATYVEEGVIIGGDVPLPSNTGWRIDAVIIEVNKDLRENYIKVIQGEEVSAADYDSGERPVRPRLLGKKQDGSWDPEYTGNVFQYALAYISRPISSVQTDIQESDIVNVVGDETGQTPMVSALAIAGIPSGGLTGQVLAKKSSDNGNVGWYNIHKLPAEKWYLAQGMTEEDIIAAFRFVEVASETDALRNVNESETQYLLSKSSNDITWTAEKGFKFAAGRNGLYNHDLHVAVDQVNSMFFGYSGAPYLNASTGYGGIFLFTAHTNYRSLLITFNSGSSNIQKSHSVGNNNSGGQNSNTPKCHLTANYYEKGVLSANYKGIKDFDFYHNGNAESLTSSSATGAYNGGLDTDIVIGNIGNTESTLKSWYCTAAVFCNRVLTNDEHLEIAENILKLGGGTQ